VKKLAIYIYRFVRDQLPDRMAISLTYLLYFHKLPNIDRPITFNEKIAWRKLRQRSPEMTRYIDKIQVKSILEGIIGEKHIIPNLWTGQLAKDIPFDELEAPYVIKTNHASGCNIFVTQEKSEKQDENSYFFSIPLSGADRIKIIALMTDRLKVYHGQMFREWAYRGIKPNILVEKMLPSAEGIVPEDYKFFVFKGKTRVIQVDYARFSSHKRSLYREDWSLLPVRFIYAQAGEVAAPQHLSEMLVLAETIGASFDFVRVDLYSTPLGIFFGEATFYPEAGKGVFFPSTFDLELGKLWEIDRL